MSRSACNYTVLAAWCPVVLKIKITFQYYHVKWIDHGVRIPMAANIAKPNTSVILAVCFVRAAVYVPVISQH
jgi:hypothetical protein